LKKVFLDSDIIRDISEEREPHYENSANVMSLITSGDILGFTSSLIIANLYYLQRKDFGHYKNIEFIKKLRKILIILSVTDKTIEKALYSDFKDFEDAIQHFCALENNMDCFITRNIKDYDEAEIPIFTPIDFLNNIIKK